MRFYTRSSIIDGELPQKIEGMTIDQSGSVPKSIGQTRKVCPRKLCPMTSYRYGAKRALIASTSFGRISCPPGCHTVVTAAFWRS